MRNRCPASSCASTANCSFEQEVERRPIHEQVLDEAVTNHAAPGNQFWQRGLEDDTGAGAALRRDVGARIQGTKFREFCTLGIVLGSQYRHSPVIVDDEGAAAMSDLINYVPSSRPGCRAPHGRLHDGSSLYDLLGSGFTLVATQGARAEAIDQARLQAVEAGVPLVVLQPTEPSIEALYPCCYTRSAPTSMLHGAATPGRRQPPTCSNASAAEPWLRSIPTPCK